MQFLIMALDGKDPDALDRRMAARTAHLENVRKMEARKTFIRGGAILDEDDRMIGSTLYVEFPSREDVDEYLKKDPYVTGKVWLDIKVYPIRLVKPLE